MNEAKQSLDGYRNECTLVLCECCYEIILEDEAKYHDELPYCHHCIEDVRS